MEPKNVNFDVKNGIGFLTIDRPKAMNALNVETIEEIRLHVREVKESGSIRALIITGAGEKAFVAGADITEIRQLGLKDGFDAMRKGHLMTNELETVGVPTIAAVNGLALGGGCEIALSCSLRLVTENSKFGFPEVGLGVIPGYGGTQRLSRLIGKGRALWYLLTGEMIDSDRAVEMGLANLKVKAEELIEKCTEIANKIASKGPFAVKALLCAVNQGFETDLQTALVLEASMCNLALASEDKKEGINAFFEKRKPVFKGE
ncbi:enoyl-CoA hydratase/isomerase family protein [Desulfatiglans anilini]|uniref:enoyl-CoA hydratase/isomerase family protein n=1 Tax=Desulfatiglans anilini TaxID=90728 RepID=UPI0003FC860F|nr:enoyl-CoA hydratase-related protein [Desulfatiglans anilini]